MLTKTITDTIDTDSGALVSHDESFEELSTSYVASVTICDPWKKIYQELAILEIVLFMIIY